MSDIDRREFLAGVAATVASADALPCDVVRAAGGGAVVGRWSRALARIAVMPSAPASTRTKSSALVAAANDSAPSAMAGVNGRAVAARFVPHRLQQRRQIRRGPGLFQRSKELIDGFQGPALWTGACRSNNS